MPPKSRFETAWCKFAGFVASKGHWFASFDGCVVRHYWSGFGNSAGSNCVERSLATMTHPGSQENRHNYDTILDKSRTSAA
jgi:hypothetical protein